jgi:hypothetical protein
MGIGPWIFGRFDNAQSFKFSAFYVPLPFRMYCKNRTYAISKAHKALRWKKGASRKLPRPAPGPPSTPPYACSSLQERTSRNFNRIILQLWCSAALRCGWTESGRVGQASAWLHGPWLKSRSNRAVTAEAGRRVWHELGGRWPIGGEKKCSKMYTDDMYVNIFRKVLWFWFLKCLLCWMLGYIVIRNKIKGKVKNVKVVKKFWAYRKILKSRSWRLALF